MPDAVAVDVAVPVDVAVLVAVLSVTVGVAAPEGVPDGVRVAVDSVAVEPTVADSAGEFSDGAGVQAATAHKQVSVSAQGVVVCIVSSFRICARYATVCFL